MMKCSFSVLGPYDVPCEGTAGNKAIDTPHASKFWSIKPLTDLADRRGVYIFGVRSSRGYTPIYVGKAANTFRQEALHVNKLHKYNLALRDWDRGTPVLLFVVHPVQKGPVNKSAIADVERFLIRLAKKANPNLKNNHHTGEEKWWEISGFDAGKGKPSNAAVTLRKMMKWG